MKNLNVAVREWQDDVVFLHKIVEGAADKSYGIHVARLAGVPRAVIERSKDILAQLEEEHLDASGRAKIARPAKEPKKTHLQLTLFGPADHPLLDELRRLDLEQRHADPSDPIAPAVAGGIVWQGRSSAAGRASPARSGQRHAHLAIPLLRVGGARLRRTRMQNEKCKMQNAKCTGSHAERGNQR